MARQGRGIALVIAGAVVLAAALAVTYLFAIAPRAQKSKMQDEVGAFAERWSKLRSCFYGSTARGDNPAEAVVLRELTEPQLATEIAVCEEALRDARREEGPTTGIDEVESAWAAMTDARRDLAKALAIRLQVPPPRPIPELRAALGEAATAAEAAYAALRETAGLDPDPLDAAAVPDATLEPIALGGEPAEQVWVSGNKILAARRDGDNRLVAVLDGGEPRVTTVARTDVLAIGARWVARIRDGVIVAAELDAPAGGGEPRVVEIGKAKDGEVITMALDNGKGGRLIAVFRDPLIYTLRSVDGGASWKAETAVYGSGRPLIDSDPLAGRLVVTYQDNRAELGGPELASARRPIHATPCFAESVSWWLQDSGLVAGGFDDALSPVANSEEMPWLAHACTDAQALGVAPFDSEIDLPATKLRLCDRGDCRIAASLPRAHGAGLAAGIGPLAGPIVAFAADHLALVWVGSKQGVGLAPRSPMRLPADARLTGVVEWNGQIRAVLESGGRGSRAFALATFD